MRRLLQASILPMHSIATDSCSPERTCCAFRRGSVRVLPEYGIRRSAVPPTCEWRFRARAAVRLIERDQRAVAQKSVEHAVRETQAVDRLHAGGAELGRRMRARIDAHQKIVLS